MNNLKQTPWADWEIIDIIGRGSFGTVYRIQRKLVDNNTEYAALKVLSIPQNPAEIESMRSEGYDDAAIAETLKEHLNGIINEYNIMQKLDGHTNIVNSKDLATIPHEDGVGWDIFIRMELLTPLMKELPDTVSDDTVIRLGTDICKALQLCKKHNIIHRDIKPQNIFVSKNGDYKLGDFGIAKVVEKTVSGTKIGTYKYMAPEVYYSQPYGQSADVYSLGLVLYWMLNDKRMPFTPPASVKMTTSQDEEARNRRLSGEPLPPPANGSEALKQIVLKACAFDSKNRYNSADELLSDLEKVKNGTFIATSGSRNDFSDEEGTMGPMGFSNDEQTTGPDWKKHPEKSGTNQKKNPKKIIIPILVAVILIGGAIALATILFDFDIPISPANVPNIITTTTEKATTTEKGTTEIIPTTQEEQSIIDGNARGAKKIGYVGNNTPDSNGLNVRSAATYDSSMVTTVPEGQQLYYYPETLQNGYVYCELTNTVTDGVSGWVLLEYLADEKQVDLQEVYRAYQAFLQDPEKQDSFVDITRTAVADINGDAVPDLIFKAFYGGTTTVFTYDPSSLQVEHIFSETTGKAYNLDVAYNSEKQQLIAPWGDTGGGGYSIYKLDGKKSEIVYELKRNNGKFTETGSAEYIINGDGVSYEEYMARSEDIYEGFTYVDYTIENMRVWLNRRIDP